MERETAREAARRLFKKVNYQGGALQSYELATMLEDTYGYLKMRTELSIAEFKPTANDIKTYEKTLDVNGDGKVTLEDLEAVAIEALCGNVLLNKGAVQSNKSPSKPTYDSMPTKQSPSVTASPDRQTTSSEANERNFNTKTIYYLNLTKNIFKAYVDKNNTITANEVPDVLAETYEMLGRKGYRPSAEDVKVWLKMCDGDGDGHVEYR